MAGRATGAAKRSATEVEDIHDLDKVSKRLKQSQLCFKVNVKDSKPLTPVHNNSKKRRLSGQESPNSKPKLQKLPDLRTSGEKAKPARDADNEVSSTSSGEAEHSVNNCGKSKSVKGNLDSFVKRDDEISSTNEVIDLTDSLDDVPNENFPLKARSPQKSVLRSPQCKGKTVPKEKPAVHFSRKLIFGEKKTPENELEDKTSELASQFKEEPEVLSADVSVKSDVECVDASEKEMKIAAEINQESANEDANDKTAHLDSSQDFSACEKSNTATSTPKQKKESGPSCKTPTLQNSRSTDSPMTPAVVSISSSSSEELTPSSGNKNTKVMSKKQLAKAAARQKVKAEKERQKQEAKEQKEQERLEKKKQRYYEKAEKERMKKEQKEKKDKERQEKKEQAEKEKQEKLQQKEEEKQKKEEILNAKNEEKKKKEEEKRQKEEQKQKEAEEKLRQAEKRKAAFTSFFVKSKPISSTKPVTKTTDNLFIPFELKKDMTLAPMRRDVLTEQRKQVLDDGMGSEKANTNYLEDLKQGTRQPVRTNRMLRKKKDADQDVVLLVHDSETVKKVTHAVKILQFHTDYRPPYFGTWRKNVTGVSPRNPWKKDEEIFDYEVDSDDEWEEEEPGESLSDSNGEEEEGEEEDDGDDDGWMVPHGYLSADEGCEDDEDVTPEVLKARQRAKAQAWEAELKAKKQVLPPLHLGCFWLDSPCSNPEYLDILKGFEMVCLRTVPLETLISCPAVSDSAGEKTSSKTSPSSKRCRKQALPEEAIPDLVRLVHGNTFGIKKLVREFRLYWKQKNSDLNISVNDSRLEEDDVKALNESEMETSVYLDNLDGENEMPAEKAAEKTTQVEPMKAGLDDETKEAEQQDKKLDDSVVNEDSVDNCVSKRQLEMKIMAIAVREKREGRKPCWYVHDDVLKLYNLTDLPLENSWAYVSGDMTKKTPLTPTAEKETSQKTSEKKLSKTKCKVTKSVSEEETKTPHKEKICASADTTPQSAKTKKESSAKKTPKDQPSIMAFAKMKGVGEVANDKNQVRNVPNESCGSDKAIEVIDVDMESSEEEKESESSSAVGEEKMEVAQESGNTEDNCLLIC